MKRNDNESELYHVITCAISYFLLRCKGESTRFSILNNLDYLIYKTGFVPYVILQLLDHRNNVQTGVWGQQLHHLDNCLIWSGFMKHYPPFQNEPVLLYCS